MISNSKSKNDEFEIINKDLKNQNYKLHKLRKYIEENFDYVGKDFAKE